MDLVSWTDSGFSGRWLVTSQDQCFPTILNQTTLKFILKSGRNLVSLVRTAEHPPALRREGGGMSQEMFPCLLLSVAFMEISSWFTKRKENMTWVLCGYRKFPQLQTPEQEWGTLERCPCLSGSMHYWPSPQMMDSSFVPTGRPHSVPVKMGAQVVRHLGFLIRSKCYWRKALSTFTSYYEETSSTILPNIHSSGKWHLNVPVWSPSFLDYCAFLFT